MISRFLSRLSAHTPNARIFRAGVIVSAFGVLTIVATGVKELTLARYFGRGEGIDAFFIAYLLPSFVVSLISGSLGTALIPVLVDARHRGGAGVVQEVFSSAMFFNLLTLSGIALGLGLLASYYLPYLAGGFAPEKLRMTRELLLGLLPFIVFSGTAVCITSALNAQERFALPALVPLMTPLVVILFVYFMASKLGAFAIVSGTVLGSILEIAALAKALKARGIRFVFRWAGFTPDVRSVLRQFAPMVAGSLLIGSTLVIDKAMAAMLSAGSVAALSYANRVVGAVFAVGATALGTATFPYFSKMIAESNWPGCRHTLVRYSILVVSLTVPVTLCLMALSTPLVRLLFQRGAFTAADTELVSKIQICYLLQVPFYIWGMLFVRFLSAARRNEVLMYGAGISLMLDIVLNLVFMRYWGVVGIALSTSAVYFCSFMYLMICSLKLLRESQGVSVPGGMSPNPSCLE